MLFHHKSRSWFIVKKSFLTGVFANMTYLSLLDLSYNSISEDTFKSGSLFTPAEGQKSLPLLNLNLAYNNIKSIPNTAFDYLDNLDQVKFPEIFTSISN